MPGGTRTIIVKELKVIHKGRNRQGSEYTIRQVVATTEQGVPIEQNLRTFEDNLPKNQPIEVEIEVYNSEQYGVSYTIKKKGGKKGLGKKVDALGGELNQLKARVAKLEEQTKGAAAAPAAAPTPQAAPPAQPPQPPPPPVPATGGLPSDDDIPF